MSRPSRPTQLTPPTSSFRTSSGTSRRHFAVSSLSGVAGAAIATGSLPGLAFARQETPESPDVATETILELSSLDGFVAGAAREFYLSASGLDALFGSETIAVLAVGIEFEDEEIASTAVTDIRGAIPEALEGVIGSPTSGTKRSAAGDLGDENLGLVLTLPFPPERESNEVDAGVTIIRKGGIVQVIVSVAYAEALEQATALAETIDGRWPSDALLDLLPTEEEVTAPLVLRVEAEF